MANKGGKRAGAGRKKGARNKSTEDVKVLVDAIFRRIDPIEKAIKLLESGSDKTQAMILMRLLEYRYGKPVQPIEGSGDDGAIRVTVEHIASHSATA